MPSVNLTIGFSTGSDSWDGRRVSLELDHHFLWGYKYMKNIRERSYYRPFVLCSVKL